MAAERCKKSKIYFNFAIHFVAVVIGRKKFDSYCWKHALSKFVTVSDEAFALLIFENNYDRWMNMAVNDDWSSSSVQPIYTSGGNANQTPKAKVTNNKTKKYLAKHTLQNGHDNVDSVIVSVGSTSKYQGWSVKGIQHFNVLYDKITKLHNSKEGKEFEELLLLHCEERNSKKGKKKSEATSIKYEAVRHDLWDTTELIDDEVEQNNASVIENKSDGSSDGNDIDEGADKDNDNENNDVPCE